MLCAHFFFWSGLQQLYLFINTNATGPVAVHFKLLFQKQWCKAETWDLSQPAPWGLPDIPQPWGFTASAGHPLWQRDFALTSQAHNWSTKQNLPGSSPSSLDGLRHWWWQRTTYVTPAALPKGPLAPELWGCWGQCRKGSSHREPRVCWWFGLGVQPVGTFPHPSPGLSQHKCPLPNPIKMEAQAKHTEKTLRFAIAPQR